MRSHASGSRAGTHGSASLLAAVFLAAALDPARLHAQAEPDTAMDGEWHFRIVPFFWATSIEGRASVGGIPEVPLEVSFSQIVDKFDFGKLGRFEARRGRFGLGLDTVYLDLGADVATQDPVLGVVGLTADVRQFIGEGFAFYRALSGGRGGEGYLDVIAGIRYTDTSKELVDPSGNEIPGTRIELDWLDAMGGARFRAPLSDRFGVSGRGDLAGFGSDLTWNLQAGFDAQLGRRWAAGAEYRWLDFDYDEGEGLLRKLLDLQYRGPYVWLSFSW